jgi:hypothetical protein
MLSVLFRAAFSIRKFPPRGFAPIARDDRALVVGLLGRGMDDPLVGMAKGGLDFL